MKVQKCELSGSYRMQIIILMSTLQESMCETIYTTVETLCPALYLERSPLSVSHLAQGVSTPHAYKPRDVLLAQLAGTTSLLADAVDRPETFADLISFGDTEVTDCGLVFFVYCLFNCV